MTISLLAQEFSIDQIEHSYYNIRVDVHTLLARTDLRALAEEAGARFERGRSSRCPLHSGSDNPTAFRLYRGRDGRWRWHCFTRCPLGANDGDAVTLYMRWRGVDFLTAVHELAGRVGAEVETLRLVRQAHQPAQGPWRSGGVVGWRNTGVEERASMGNGEQGSLDVVAATLLQAPSETWQARAREFVSYTQECLWSAEGQAAAGYLTWERGLSDRTVALWGLGYNPEDEWEDPAAWGLEDEEDNGECKRVWLPRGIVIPAWEGEDLCYIKVRRPLPGGALARHIEPVTRLPQVKYANVRGGRAALFGTNALRGLPDVLLTEGEFDALLAWQAAGDLVDVATPGGARQRPGSAAKQALRRAKRLLIAYDSDEAGAAGKAIWQKTTRRARVVSLPGAPGKEAAHDVTAYWQAGGDVRAWIATL